MDLLQTEFNVEAKQAFLTELAKYGNVTLAADTVGFSPHTILAHRKSDANFAVAYDDAMVLGNMALEAEARRRAFTGWKEPVYFRGDRVGAIRKFSDNLLAMLLRATDRKFRLGNINELTGKDGGPIEFRDVKEMSREQLIQIARAGLPAANANDPTGSGAGTSNEGEGAIHS